MATEQIIVTRDLKDRFLGETSKKVEFYFYDGSGNPKPLTGASAFLQFRLGSKEGRVVADFSIGTGLTWVDIDNGILQLDAITQIDWGLGMFYYDIEIHVSGGDRSTWVEGIMEIKLTTTKPSV